MTKMEVASRFASLLYYGALLFFPITLEPRVGWYQSL